jgi:threonine aldolase
MAQLLAQELATIPKIQVTQKVEANGVFALLPRKHIPSLQKHYFFYVWNEERSEVRFMTSFDTTEADIQNFIRVVRKTIK